MLTTLNTRNKRNAKKGFTLTELAIVIAVIAILIAVLVPTFTSIINNAKETSTVSNARNAVTEYFTEYNEYPEDGAVIDDGSNYYVIYSSTGDEVSSYSVEENTGNYYVVAKSGSNIDLTNYSYSKEYDTATIYFNINPDTTDAVYTSGAYTIAGNALTAFEADTTNHSSDTASVISVTVESVTYYFEVNGSSLKILNSTTGYSVTDAWDSNSVAYYIYTAGTTNDYSISSESTGTDVTLYATIYYSTSTQN